MRLSQAVNLADLRRRAQRRHPRGESVAAREANGVGTAYILSTFFGQRLEGVCAAVPGMLWYQLYVPGGRAVAEAAMARARAGAVLIGRADGWVLRAVCGPGIARAIALLKTDLKRTMRLLGCASTNALDGTFVEGLNR